MTATVAEMLEQVDGLLRRAESLLTLVPTEARTQEYDTLRLDLHNYLGQYHGQCVECGAFFTSPAKRLACRACEHKYQIRALSATQSASP